MLFNKINAPTMAYITVYGRKPNPPIRGHEATHETYKLNGIDIDKAIPKRAMSSIMKLRDIETRASCQGSNERLVTFLIFRPIYQKETYVHKLVQNIKALGLKAYYNIGTLGKFRICVAEKLWYSKEIEKEFKEWWNNLPNKLLEAIVKTNELFGLKTAELTLFAFPYRSHLTLIKKYGLLSIRAAYETNNIYIKQMVDEFLKKYLPQLTEYSEKTIIEIFDKAKAKTGFGPDSLLFFFRDLRLIDSKNIKKQLKETVTIAVDYKQLIKYKPKLVYKKHFKEVTWTELKDIAIQEKYDKLFEDYTKEFNAVLDYPYIFVDAYKLEPSKFEILKRRS